jgi:hypothetical protein
MGEGYRPAPSPSRARAPSTRAPSSPLDARNARAIHARIRTPHADAHRAAARALDDPESHDWPIQRAISHRPYTARAIHRARHDANADHANAPLHRASIASKPHPSHPRLARHPTRARATPIRIIHPSIHPSIHRSRTITPSNACDAKKRTTKEPRGAATHAGLVEPCFTLAPRRDNERDAVSGAVTDAMADIGAWKWRRRVATHPWSIVDGRSSTVGATMARGVR